VIPVPIPLTDQPNGNIYITNFFFGSGAMVNVDSEIPERTNPELPANVIITNILPVAQHSAINVPKPVSLVKDMDDIDPRREYGKTVKSIINKRQNNVKRVSQDWFINS
jgi:hypothetical protein